MKRKVQVWVYRTSPSLEFLLLHTQPERGSFWQPVTGGVDEGESDAEAAARELREETGIAAHPEPLGYEFEFEGRWGAAHETVFTIDVTGGPISSIVTDPSEHDAYAWVSTDEAFARTHFASNREALRRLRERIAQSHS